MAAHTPGVIVTNIAGAAGAALSGREVTMVFGTPNDLQSWLG